MPGRFKIKHLQLTLMILPAVVFFFVFSYIPMVGLSLAFQDFQYSKGMLSDFIGFKNFEFLFQSGDALRITRNTILYNLSFIIINLVLQVTCAIAISEFINRRFKKIAQTMMFLPYFLSWVVLGAFVYNMFSYEYGVVNTVLGSLNLDLINVYSNTGWWPFIIVVFQSWKSVGYGTIIYTAAIVGIDQEMYEAADIDGANVLQKIINITLPMLKPTIVVLILLNLSHVIRGDFNMFYNLTGNNPMLFGNTDIIETYVFRALTSTGDIGMGAAAGFYQAVFGFVVIVSVNTIIKKLQPDYSLF
ncbi:MAG: sugar transporter permease [Paenibacillaceae bacterium]|nr:sugar transporter permease [Paenibacillaceae bacterium]